MRNPRIFLYKGVINHCGKVNLIKSFNLMSAHNLCSAVCHAGWSLGFSSIGIILPAIYISCSIFLAGLDFWLLEEQWSFTKEHLYSVFSLFLWSARHFRLIWTYWTLVLVNSFSLFVWSSLMYRWHNIFNHWFFHAYVCVHNLVFCKDLACWSSVWCATGVEWKLRRRGKTWRVQMKSHCQVLIFGINDVPQISVFTLKKG